MSEKRAPSPQEERRASEKKLRKREKKLIDRLFEAHEEEADAWLRLKKAEARLAKRKARVQRIKNRLEDVREELAALRNPSEQQATDETDLTPPLSLNLSDDLSSRSDALDDDDDEEEDEEDESEEDEEKEDLEEYVDIHIIRDIDEANTPPADAEKVAHEARVAAEAAEQAARLAAERAREIANRLDQVGLSRHLIQELSELEAEAERTQHIAQEAGLAARVAEQLVMKAPLTEPEEESQQEPPEASEQEEISEADETGETTQESTDIDTVAAMIIADAAAVAAAEAEAIAEVSSARVREARNLVSQADEVLEQVRSGIDTGTLVGEDAEILLHAAERDASRARMALSEAEMAETKARKAAFAAEAEAEITALAAFSPEQENTDQAVQAQEGAEPEIATTEAPEQPGEQAEEAELQETQEDTIVNADQPEPVSVTSPNDEQVSTVIVEQSEPIISDPADVPVNQMVTEQEEVANNENVEKPEEEVKDPPPEVVTPSEATVEQQSGSTDEVAQSEEVIVEIVEGEEQGQFVLKETQNNGNEIYLVQEEQAPEGEVPQGSPFRSSADHEKKTGDPATAQKSVLVAIRAFQTTSTPSGLNGKHGASHGHEEDDREATIKMPAIRLERPQEPEEHSE